MPKRNLSLNPETGALLGASAATARAALGVASGVDIDDTVLLGGAISLPEISGVGDTRRGMVEIFNDDYGGIFALRIIGAYRDGISGDRYRTDFAPGNPGLITNGPIGCLCLPPGTPSQVDGAMGVESDIPVALSTYTPFSHAGDGALYNGWGYVNADSGNARWVAFEVSSSGRVKLAAIAAVDQFPQLVLVDKYVSRTNAGVDYAFQSKDGLLNIGTFNNATNAFVPKFSINSLGHLSNFNAQVLLTRYNVEPRPYTGFTAGGSGSDYQTDSLGGMFLTNTTIGSWVRASFREGLTGNSLIGGSTNWGRAMSVAVAFNTVNLANTTDRIRVIVGGNGGTPPLADANALATHGFGAEFAVISGTIQVRLFAYNGTYAVSAWSGSQVGDYLNHTYLVVNSDGAGNLTLYASLSSGGNIQPSTTALCTLATGPTGYQAGGKFIDIVATGDATNAPNSYCGVINVELRK